MERGEKNEDALIINWPLQQISQAEAKTASWKRQLLSRAVKAGVTLIQGRGTEPSTQPAPPAAPALSSCSLGWQMRLQQEGAPRGALCAP